MPERNILIRLESVVAGSVGRAFNAVNTNVGRLEEGFAESRREVSRLTAEVKRMTAAGEDVSDVTRRLAQAKERTAEFRREVARAKERVQQLAGHRAAAEPDCRGVRQDRGGVGRAVRRSRVWAERGGN